MNLPPNYPVFNSVSLSRNSVKVSIMQSLDSGMYVKLFGRQCFLVQLDSLSIGSAAPVSESLYAPGILPSGLEITCMEITVRPHVSVNRDIIYSMGEILDVPPYGIL